MLVVKTSLKNKQVEEQITLTIKHNFFSNIKLNISRNVQFVWLIRNKNIELHF